MSDYNDILTAVRDLVTPAVANTVIRKKVQVLDVDTKPIVVVAPEGNIEEVRMFSLNVFYKYRVYVVYASAKNELITTPSTFLTATEGIRDKLNINKLSAVTNCFNLDVTRIEEGKLEEYKLTNYDVAGWELRAWVSDTRTA